LEEPFFPWAEIHYRGSLVCEARWEERRWQLIKPPPHFLEQLPIVVEVREMVSERSFPAQIESEFGLYFAREVERA
jgi:hypothetical protein